MKIINVTLLLFTLNCLFGESLFLGPAYITKEVNGKQCTGLSSGNLALYTKDEALLRSLWEDLVRGAAEFQTRELPKMEILWGWVKEDGQPGIQLDRYPFRDQQPKSTEPIIVYINPNVDYFAGYGGSGKSSDEQKKLVGVNRSLYFFYLADLIKTWDEVGSLKKTLALAERWGLENAGYFIDTLYSVNEWTQGKSGLLTVKSMDDPRGPLTGFYNAGWYVALSEKVGVAHPDFRGALYFIDPIGIPNVWGDFQVGSQSILTDVGKYRIEATPVKGYKTPPIVEIDVKPAQEVRVELVYLPE